ncbi:hypothetical protein [Streptomyces sp. NBC_01304]|uniref:hypothetical protein n=1 Tax=Streptomyces sp. NBC_01304 TaxID=2903818 RepID=UPI002E139596|nr:hypothetical protein OG430_42985 [Streptomyces sp. NBC_01304]
MSAAVYAETERARGLFHALIGILMSADLLKADARHAFDQYRTGAVAGPYTALDSHRLFAVELLCDDLVTADDVRESVHGLIAVLNIVTDYRKAQPTDTVLSEGV